MSARSLPGQVVTPGDIEPRHVDDPLVAVRELIHPDFYAEPLILRHLTISAGSTARRTDAMHDELLYVLGGTGTLTIDQSGESSVHGVAAGTAVQVLAGGAWSADTSGDLEVLSFLIPAPVSPWASALAKPADAVVDVARLGQQSAESATSDRQFEVLFDASRGSRGATMFVGFIPTSGAPEHYHLYDEICVIVGGSGVLHTTGRAQPLEVGSAFHVAPRLLHALENPNERDLWVLGVFRPEGSAAAAYYPDGRPAPNNQD